jgi:hypothetical protein
MCDFDRLRSCEMWSPHAADVSGPKGGGGCRSSSYHDVGVERQAEAFVVRCVQFAPASSAAVAFPVPHLWSLTTLFNLWQYRLAAEGAMGGEATQQVQSLSAAIALERKYRRWSVVVAAQQKA